MFATSWALPIASYPSSPSSASTCWHYCRPERPGPGTVHARSDGYGQAARSGKGAGLPLDGPYDAFLVQGDDELGALANVHERLTKAGVDIFASSGVSDGRGAFGYLVYVREDQFERATAALNA